MATSIFDSKLVVYGNRMLSYELGKAKEYLDKINSFIKDQYGDLTLD
jgi:hypothetical protein